MHRIILLTITCLPAQSLWLLFEFCGGERRCQMLAKPARAISYNSTHYQEKRSKTRCWGWRWFWSWSTGNNFVRLEINFFDYYLGPDRNLDFSHDQCDLGKTRYILSLDIWWIFLPLEEPPYFIKEGSLLSLNIYKTESSHLSRTPTNLDRVPPPLLLSNNRFLEGVFLQFSLNRSVHRGQHMVSAQPLCPALVLFCPPLATCKATRKRLSRPTAHRKGTSICSWAAPPRRSQPSPFSRCCSVAWFDCTYSWREWWHETEDASSKICATSCCLGLKTAALESCMMKFFLNSQIGFSFWLLSTWGSELPIMNGGKLLCGRAAMLNPLAMN